MMWKEFEEIAGYEVAYSDYHDYIEPMYMALPAVNKQEFVKMIDKKRFALKTEKQIISEMKKIAAHLFETCEQYTDFEAKDRLENLRKEWAERFAGSEYDYCYIRTETIYPGYRGCSYPITLVAISNWNSFYNKEIELFARP